MRAKTLAKANKLKLIQKADRIIMAGGTWGEHSMYEPCYNYRVDAHWRGYMMNNGMEWIGHPGYFPQPKS